MSNEAVVQKMVEGIQKESRRDDGCHGAIYILSEHGDYMPCALRVMSWGRRGGKEASEGPGSDPINSSILRCKDDRVMLLLSSAQQLVSKSG